VLLICVRVSTSLRFSVRLSGIVGESIEAVKQLGFLRGASLRELEAVSNGVGKVGRCFGETQLKGAV